MVCADPLAAQRAGMSNVSAGAGYRFSPYRRSMAGEVGAIYPNPFLDVAQNYMPRSIQELFSQCEYYAMANPLISAVVTKMSAYGITDLVYESANEGVKEQFRKLFEEYLHIRQFLVNTFMDYHCYGNAFVSVLFPFRKFLICRSCGAAVPVDRAKYRFVNFRFRLNCRSCGDEGIAKVVDRYYPSPREIKLVRWYPKNIVVSPIDVTGEMTYRYVLPRRLRNDLTIGRPSVVEKVPQMFIEALRKNRIIMFRKDHVFHLKRSTVSREDSAWGTPMILPVLKDAFYLQILRKGQEAVALDHTVPLRVLFPQPAAADANPYTNISIANWQEAVKAEVAQWRKDPNHIPIMPLPIGYQSIGGDSRALILHQEIRVWAEHIVAGMGVPVEFVFGGLSYSGSSVSLRMLENTFLGLREDASSVLRWIRNTVCSALRWPRPDIKFKPFKMADDLQRAAFDFQLVGSKLLSKDTLLQERDHRYEREQAQIRKELDRELELMREQQVYNAETQGRASVIQAQHNAKAQQIMQQAQMEMQQQQPQPQEGQQQGQAQEGQPQQGQQPQQQASAQSQQAPPGRPAVGPGGIVGVIQSPMNEQRGIQVAQGGGDLRLAAANMANQLRMMPDPERYAFLNDLRMQNPELHQLVLQYLYSMGSAGKPLPEQRPPRRGPENAII